MYTKPKVLVILGPTASGKSHLAITLAHKYIGEIVSADSRQIYKGFDIGTGKVTILERSLIAHHLLNLTTANKILTLSDWLKKAQRAMSKIVSKKKLPFIVGGTGLYLSAFINNYALPHALPDNEIRSALESQKTATLLQKLYQLDPHSAEVIDKHNKRRLIRALEYVMSQKKSFIKNQKQNKPRYNFTIIGIKLPKNELERKIKERVRRMIRTGLETEVRKLAQRYDWNLPAMQSIGYQEWRPYFEGKMIKKDVESNIVTHSLQYARKQMTWFRKINTTESIHWISSAYQAEKILKKAASEEGL